MYFLLMECCALLLMFSSCCHHSYVQARLAHAYYLLVLIFWYCVHFHGQIYIKGTAITQGKMS